MTQTYLREDNAGGLTIQVEDQPWYIDASGLHKGARMQGACFAANAQALCDSIVAYQGPLTAAAAASVFASLNWWVGVHAGKPEGRIVAVYDTTSHAVVVIEERVAFCAVAFPHRHCDTCGGPVADGVLDECPTCRGR